MQRVGLPMIEVRLMECYIDGAARSRKLRNVEDVASFMRKFADYPVVVNYNLHTQLRNQSAEVKLHEAGRYEKAERVYRDGGGER